jgi:hypothetical protein
LQEYIIDEHSIIIGQLPGSMAHYPLATTSEVGDTGEYSENECQAFHGFGMQMERESGKHMENPEDLA